jgi:hypothetical protein
MKFPELQPPLNRLWVVCLRLRTGGKDPGRIWWMRFGGRPGSIAIAG